MASQLCETCKYKHDRTCYCSPNSCCPDYKEESELTEEEKMNDIKKSWYANKSSDMDVVRISESDDWIVDYDKRRGMYRVSYFQNNHFVDEHWFDAYEEREVDNRI